jgi:hypothetical protein
MKFALPLIVSTAVLFVPQLAAACAVCFAGRSDETRIAFVVTTAFMTALPLLTIGSLVWWLRWRARQIRDEHRSASPATD